jgi:hypothetical protein
MRENRSGAAPGEAVQLGDKGSQPLPAAEMAQRSFEDLNYDRITEGYIV